MLYKWNNKTWIIVHRFTTWFTDFLKPTVETYCSEEKNYLKILLLTENTPGYPRALMNIYNEIDVVSMPANTATILKPMDQVILFTFKSYNLRNTFIRL